MSLALDARATLGDRLAAAESRLARAGVPEPRADAEVLLVHALGGVDRAALVVRAREPLDAAAEAAYDACLARRECREPVAYITGTREFWSLAFAVDRRVLVPRPETELVVETALRLAPRARRVLDVGTGSGAIAVAIARELPAARVVAVDFAADALAVAAGNRRRLAPGVALVRGDLVSAFRRPAFDLVVANPPYCASGTVVQAEVRDFEPATALDAGPDGLDVLGALIDAVPAVLEAGGWFVTEVGAGQADLVAAGMRTRDAFTDVTVRCDLAGVDRVVAGRRPG